MSKEKIVRIIFKDGPVVCSGGVPPEGFFSGWVIEDALAFEISEFLSASEIVERFSDILTEEDKLKIHYGTGR